MFVIADNRHVKFPSYLKKVIDGLGLVSISLSESLTFKSYAEAKVVLDTIKKDELFTFGIYELGIK